MSAAIAGCGGTSAAGIVPVPAHADGPAITAPDAQHNAADVSFADHVITGEQQAVAVGKLTDNNSSLPPVKALGTQVAAQGQRQISELTGFLSAWNAPAPDSGKPIASAHAIGYRPDGARQLPASAPPGTISGDQLRLSSGPAFDQQFLSTMIGQRGSEVTLARTELASGQNPDAKALAEHLVTADRSEISEMRTILAGPDFGHF